MEVENTPLGGELWEAIHRIEKTIGLVINPESSSIFWELERLRGLSIGVPSVEIDLPITGDSFILAENPLDLGDSHVVNGHVIITTKTLSVIAIVEWREVTFIGKTGTLVGAGGRFNGKKVTVSYFKDSRVNYSIKIDNGFIATLETDSINDDIVVKDKFSEDTYLLKVSSNGSVMSIPTELEEQNNILTDITTGDSYYLYAEDDFINWRLGNV